MIEEKKRGPGRPRKRNPRAVSMGDHKALMHHWEAFQIASNRLRTDPTQVGEMDKAAGAIAAILDSCRDAS